jgi:adenylate kinase family enzyme
MAALSVSSLAMKKVAVFGNAGGGKSRLARRLSETAGLPLYCLDMVQFREGRYWPEERGGGKIPDDEYLKVHADIIKREEWVIDGTAAWPRLGNVSLQPTRLFTSTCPC